MSSTVVSPLTRRVFLVALAAQVGIVVTGGAVRLTGSGLGCETWPECTPGSYTPVPHEADGWHPYIEFGNRLLTFVVTAAIIAAIIAAWRHRPRRAVLVKLAALQVVGVAGQAVLGGITVLTDLHPIPVAGHFLLSMALVAAAVVLLERGNEGDSPPVSLVRQEIRWLGITLVALAAVVLTVGTIVTGSGPHAGDEQARRFGFDPRLVSWLHADVVVLFVGLVVAMLLALRLTSAPARVQRRAAELAVVTLAQGFVGYLQFFTDLPAVLVATHMLGASLVWIATLRVFLALRERPVAVALPAATTDSPVPASRVA